MPAYSLGYNPRVERHRIIERVHPSDFSTSYICQFTVDGKHCQPFWSHKAERMSLGDDAWFESLKHRAVETFAEYGEAPALI